MGHMTHLLLHKCKIVRVTETRTTDGQPSDTETTIVDNLPCRLDTGMTLTYQNVVRGSMRAEQVAGTIYVDGDAKAADGSSLVINNNDRVTFNGSKGDVNREFEIFFIQKVDAANTFDHWELGVVDTVHA